MAALFVYTFFDKGVEGRGRVRLLLLSGVESGGGEECLSPPALPGTAHGCSTRISETKHDASEAEGPSRARQRKRVESLSEGEGEITDTLVWIESGKSKFLRVLVAMLRSKWDGNFRGRETRDGD